VNLGLLSPLPEHLHCCACDTKPARAGKLSKPPKRDAAKSAFEDAKARASYLYRRRAKSEL